MLEQSVLKQRALEFFKKADIVITKEEESLIEFTDFGLGDIENTGLEAIVYVNTERRCANELVLFPNQTCPEHYHPPIDGKEGKEETPNRAVEPPEGAYTVFHEMILNLGGQYTLPPCTKHWFRAGNEGAVVSEFSTQSRGENDIFTDKRIDVTGYKQKERK